MPANRPLAIGPHAYSREDARRTLSCIGELWEHHRHATDPDERWRVEATGFLAGIASITGIVAPGDTGTGIDAGFADLDSAFAEIGSRVARAEKALDDEHRVAALAAIWDFFPRLRRLDHLHSGRVAHLHASKGLPKSPIANATVGWKGIEGDVQRVRAHHGRPWQALCIWSVDALETLRAEGHPISPGFAGENLTVAGVPAGAFRPGARFRAGGVEGFLTAYAIPCSKNAAWFAGGDFDRMSHGRGDQCRLYAMVTRPGDIAVGDAFELTTDR